MAKFTVSAVKRTTLPTKAGGTWVKTEVKLQELGGEIYEIGNGIGKNAKENLRAGSIIEGYTEKRPWTMRDGSIGYNNVLNGITAEYVYKLLLRINPDVEVMKDVDPVNQVSGNGSWDGVDEGLQEEANPSTDSPNGW